MFRTTVRCGLFLLLAWTSSAGAVLVPLSASELARVKPTLVEVGQIDQQVNKLSSSFPPIPVGSRAGWPTQSVPPPEHFATRYLKL